MNKYHNKLMSDKYNKINYRRNQEIIQYQNKLITKLRDNIHNINPIDNLDKSTVKDVDNLDKLTVKDVDNLDKQHIETKIVESVDNIKPFDNLGKNIIKKGIILTKGTIM